LLSLVTPHDLAAAGGYTEVELGARQGGGGIARGISINGEVAGRSVSLHGTQTTAFVWGSDHQTVAIGALPGGENSRAIGINDKGDVVGFSNTATSMHAFFWSRRNGIEDLGTLPGDTGSKADAI